MLVTLDTVCALTLRPVPPIGTPAYVRLSTLIESAQELVRVYLNVGRLENEEQTPSTIRAYGGDYKAAILREYIRSVSEVKVGSLVLSPDEYFLSPPNPIRRDKQGLPVYTAVELYREMQLGRTEELISVTGIVGFTQANCPLAIQNAIARAVQHMYHLANVNEVLLSSSTAGTSMSVKGQIDALPPSVVDQLRGWRIPSV